MWNNFQLFAIQHFDVFFGGNARKTPIRVWKIKCPFIKKNVRKRLLHFNYSYNYSYNYNKIITKANLHDTPILPFVLFHTGFLCAVPPKTSKSHSPGRGGGLYKKETVKMKTTIYRGAECRNYYSPWRHWTPLVIVKVHSSHLVYLNICRK